MQINIKHSTRSATSLEIENLLLL
jgi:hypothetical protein